ncbi:phospholipid-transporting ATPase ABCA3-like [Uranotaenia lowii]|uniref:phospholipid-transporting ATPase ABCA3-like n=1 Tax=Uranotaenia lowii TaxID=190385 RepID=UPI002479DE79|nr:phospholipid-transporting ATPase ABCA3-like [Uranotaenia lowii]
MAATSNWDKFVLLLWKNWIIQLRHYLQTLFEILVPVLCCSILLLVRGLVDPDFIEKETIFRRLGIENLFRYDSIAENKLVYSPQNALLDDLMKDASQSLNVSFESYANARELESTLMERDILAGIEFDDLLKDATELPEKLSVALRFPGELRMAGFFENWQTRLLMVPFSPRLRSRIDDTGGIPNYFMENFASVQTAISKAFLRARNPDLRMPFIYLNRYPYPPYYNDPILEPMVALLSLIILLSFFYPCIVMIKHITIEKERQLKEAMKIMGLANWLHWSAWFVKNMLLLVVSISLITILLCVRVNNSSILEYSDWTAVWFFLFVYSIATVCFCFMMSVFFNKANLAAGIGGLMWFVFVMPYNLTSQNYDSMSTGSKIGMSIFSNTAMSFGVLGTLRMEANQLGLRWSSFFEPATIDDGLSVGLVIIMLLVDALIYLLIALYVEQVMPGEFGVAKPWNFLFKKEFWTGIPSDEDRAEKNGHVAENSKFFEPDPSFTKPGIQIKNLRKVYNKTKPAVQNLNLNMYEDQITVLLGHNGAGKTTTMSMLTGMFSPTSGTALLNGCDIRTNIEGVRESLGLCPQHNVLFDEMTVGEHLRFFGRLKGVTKGDLQQEITRYLDMLKLEDKRNAQSQTLSGGMKRKLAVGIALCGGSKVVLLDEPTSGMDPSARRALWDLLQLEKKNRTMLLSTHFMDEADVLGDRIAIMADGVLKTVGSPFFLKKTFGVGYRLICVKATNCDKAKLMGILTKYIPDIRIETDIGSELSFVLKESYIQVFREMLEDLESSMEACGITSYGISLTTMEEVFLKAGSDSLHDTPDSSDIAINTIADQYSFNNLTLLSGGALTVSQLKGQLLKKAISTGRSWVQLLIQNAIPILFVVMTFAIVRSIQRDQDLPPLTMALESYQQTVTVLEGDTASGQAVEGFRRMFAGKYEGSSHQLSMATESMNDFILAKSRESIGTVNVRYMVGVTYSSNSYIAWFNNKGYHTAPLAISLMFNGLLASGCADCELTIINKPLPYRVQTQLDALNTGINAGFQLAFNSGFAMAFVAALYVLFYIRERNNRAKLLQYVSGTKISLYWGVAFVWDMLMFVVTCLIFIITLVSFQEDGWSSATELGRVFLLLFMFGFAFLPTTYLCSFLFKVPATGFVVVLLLNIVAGAILFTAVILLKFPGIDLKDIGNALEWVFLLFPNFALTHGLNNINQIVGTTVACEKQCELTRNCDINSLCLLIPQCCVPELFSFDELGINRNLLYMLLVGLGAMFVILAHEYRLDRRALDAIKKTLFSRPKNLSNGHISREEDTDVLAEKKRVQSTNINDHNLVMRDVTKYYKSFLAVDKLSVAIDPYECFGLLGVNGAGKTTTFKMMTGDESISDGDAWVRGISLRSNMDGAYQKIGYCPQFDALLDNLTGRETLKMYALLRGVRPEDQDNVCLTLAEDLNFVKHLDKKTKEYSGGNKRKLSTALALIGNPSVVYLDEPTTGMDPGAKRQFWNMICKVRSAGKSIVLTSHSMEECEALCTRLAIMVNGEFKCLGSTQHLKNKFSKGFLLTLKVHKDENQDLLRQRTENVKEFIIGTFTGAVLKEEYMDSLSFHVPITDLRWSAMFGLMEANKTRLAIEDYALGQTTLEQVFLFFTKDQRVV